MDPRALTLGPSTTAAHGPSTALPSRRRALWAGLVPLWSGLQAPSAEALPFAIPGLPSGPDLDTVRRLLRSLEDLEYDVIRISTKVKALPPTGSSSTLFHDAFDDLDKCALCVTVWGLGGRTSALGDASGAFCSLGADSAARNSGDCHGTGPLRTGFLNGDSVSQHFGPF